MNPTAAEGINVSHLIQVNENEILGRGTYGFVFTGTLHGVQVAVKRIRLEDLALSHGECNKLMLDKLYHPYVINLLHVEQDQNYRYFAVELCATSLDRCYSDGSRSRMYKGPIPPDHIALLHLASGLDYLHSMNLVGRDITPENVLIALRPRIRMVWSDLGAYKPVSSSRQYHQNISPMMNQEQNGKCCWIAPELYENPGLVTTKSDVFEAGCIFFYIATKGCHPFGMMKNKTSVISNMLAGDPVDLKTRLAVDHFAFGLIEGMISRKAHDRPELSEVIQKLSDLL